MTKVQAGCGPRSEGRRPPPTELQLAATLTDWLDSRWLDPLIGFLVPGAGDVATAVAGLYIVLVGARRRLPRVIIARMLLNLAADTGLGAVPVLGDVADFFFRANRRNLRLLQARYPDRRARASDWLYVTGALLLLLAALCLPFLVLARLLAAVS